MATAILAGLALLLGAGCGREPSAPGPRAPNLVLVLADDLGWSDPGSFGGTAIRTPHLDALAAEGMRLTRFYADGSTCPPTRSAILTGREPARLGVRNNVTLETSVGLPADVPVLPEMLREAGYRSFHVGKWHVGHATPQLRPLGRGFERFFGFLSFGHLGASRYDNPLLQRDEEPARVVPGHLADLLVDEALALLDQARHGPIFLNLWTLAPHTPLSPPKRWADTYPRNAAGRYAALVSALDEGVGRLVAGLRERGLWEDTLFVFTSDNGGAEEVRSSNGPLRGFKGSGFEGGIRVPFLATWPGRIPAGASSDAVASTSDLAPTFVEAAGLAVEGRGFDARSLLGLLSSGGAAPEPHAGRTLFFERWPDQYAVRQGRWKLVRADSQGGLFDLTADPAESRDLSTTHPAEVRALEAEWRAWRARVGRLPAEPANLSGDVRRTDGTLHFGAGAGRVLLAPHSQHDRGDRDLSFEAWVRPDTAGGGEVRWIAGKEGAWSLLLGARGSVLLSLGSAAGPRRPVLHSQRPLPSGRWSHVAFSLMGAPRLVAALYVDGEPSATGRSIPLPPVDAPISLGADAAGGSPFLGQLRDVAIWNLPLMAEEVAAHAAARPPEP